MINYGKGISKTNEAISKANKAGKHLMGHNAVQAVKASEKSSTPPAKPAPKKK